MNKDFVDKGAFEDSSAGENEVATISGLETAEDIVTQKIEIQFESGVYKIRSCIKSQRAIETELRDIITNDPYYNADIENHQALIDSLHNLLDPESISLLELYFGGTPLPQEYDDMPEFKSFLDDIKPLYLAIARHPSIEEYLVLEAQFDVYRKELERQGEILVRKKLEALYPRINYEKLLEADERAQQKITDMNQHGISPEEGSKMNVEERPAVIEDEEPKTSTLNEDVQQETEFEIRIRDNQFILMNNLFYITSDPQQKVAIAWFEYERKIAEIDKLERDLGQEGLLLPAKVEDFEELDTEGLKEVSHVFDFLLAQGVGIKGDYESNRLLRLVDSLYEYNNRYLYNYIAHELIARFGLDYDKIMLISKCMSMLTQAVNINDFILEVIDRRDHVIKDMSDYLRFLESIFFGPAEYKDDSTMEQEKATDQTVSTFDESIPRPAQVFSQTCPIDAEAEYKERGVVFAKAYELTLNPQAHNFGLENLPVYVPFVHKPLLTPNFRRPGNFYVRVADPGTWIAPTTIFNREIPLPRSVCVDIDDGKTVEFKGAGDPNKDTSPPILNPAYDSIIGHKILFGVDSFEITKYFAPVFEGGPSIVELMGAKSHAVLIAELPYTDENGLLQFASKEQVYEIPWEEALESLRQQHLAKIQGKEEEIYLPIFQIINTDVFPVRSDFLGLIQNPLILDLIGKECHPSLRNQSEMILDSLSRIYMLITRRKESINFDESELPQKAVGFYKQAEGDPEKLPFRNSAYRNNPYSLSSQELAFVIQKLGYVPKAMLNGQEFLSNFWAEVSRKDPSFSTQRDAFVKSQVARLAENIAKALSHGVYFVQSLCAKDSFFAFQSDIGDYDYIQANIEKRIKADNRFASLSEEEKDALAIQQIIDGQIGTAKKQLTSSLILIGVTDLEVISRHLQKLEEQFIQSLRTQLESYKRKYQEVNPEYTARVLKMYASYRNTDISAVYSNLFGVDQKEFYKYDI